MKALNDQWVLRDGRMVSEGDAAEIDRLLAQDLVFVNADASGWRKLYQNRTNGRFWELSHPQSEMHGRGPRRLYELAIDRPSDWAADHP